MRFRTLGLILALAALSGLSAFSEGGKEASKGPATVRVVVWGSGYSDMYRRIETAFNTAHKDVQIQITMQSDYMTYINTKMAAGDAPDLFFSNPYNMLFNLAKAGHLMDLTSAPYMKRIYDFTKSEVTYNGKLYGVPLLLDYLGIMYNPDLFKKAGINDVPKTLSALKDAAAKLKKIGVTPFAVAHKDGWVMNQAITAMHANLLGSGLNDWLAQMNAGKGTWNVKGFSGVLDAIDIINGNANEKPLDSDYNNMISLFGKQQAAMFINGDWALGDVKKVDPNVKVGLFGYPVSENPADAKLAVDIGAVFAASATTKVPAAVNSFLDWITDPSAKESWSHYFVTEAASTPPYDYPEKADLGLVGPVYQQYLKNSNVVPWLYTMLPDGMQDEMTALLQGYLGGMKSRDDLISGLDASWHKLAAAK